MLDGREVGGGGGGEVQGCGSGQRAGKGKKSCTLGGLSFPDKEAKDEEQR